MSRRSDNRSRQGRKASRLRADKPASRPKSRRSLVRRLILAVLIVFVGFPVGLIALYSVVPPPITPLMVIRLFEGEGLDKDWVSLEAVSRHVPHAVIASEDNRFCEHNGYDWEAIGEAIEEHKDGKRLRGASTISMQTTKNILLWPGRDFVRKGLEAYLTVFVEALWTKRRIIEIYLNVAEWSSGVYGIEAAARHYFGKSAKDLSKREASLLATVLPNPRGRSAAQPTQRMTRMAATVRKRITQLGPMLDCV